ncbi:MAG: hypothetical protein PPP58_08510 [Natronomonas sp.]
MATDTAERRLSHIRGVTVTAVACLSGLIAGVAAASLGTGPTDTTGVVALVAAILTQFPLFRIMEMVGLELDVDDFSTKDYLYIVFMTFALWFVSWTILLTTGF